MWASVKVAQESHKLQDGVQFPGPPLSPNRRLVNAVGLQPTLGEFDPHFGHFLNFDYKYEAIFY
jgi:hypothetical protein